MDFSKDLSKKIARELPVQQQVVGVHYLTGRTPAVGGGGSAEGDSASKEKKKKRKKMFGFLAVILLAGGLFAFKDEFVELLMAGMPQREISYRESEEFYQDQEPGFFQRLFCKGMKTSRYCQ